MALFLFLVQIVTGILLSLYYKPSPDQAFESVRAIMTEIDFGWLIRSAHSWSANLLVAVLLLHLLTAFMMRAYRRPREMTWISGVLLLGLFMAFGFSGYLLPWNQLAFFATRVGTAIVGQIPVIGNQLLLLARGGEDVTGDTLARFYALHVVILPMLAFVLLAIHLFLVQKHGMSVPNGRPRADSQDAVHPALPAARRGGLVPGLGAAGRAGRALPLGVGREGRSVCLRARGHPAGVVFPLHVSGPEEGAVAPRAV
jgi:quinol-cytochrome oxidoreductase complex cytochrome b subunit